MTIRLRADKIRILLLRILKEEKFMGTALFAAALLVIAFIFRRLRILSRNSSIQVEQNERILKHLEELNRKSSDA